MKCADKGDIHHEKSEYDDVAAAAKAAGLPFQQL